MKLRRDGFFLRFIDRAVITALILSLIVMPVERTEAAPEAEPEQPETVVLDDTPSPSDTESKSGSIADSDIAVTNEMIVVYDDAGVSDTESEQIQEKAEEALDDIDAEVKDEVAESNDQQGTVVVAEIPEDLNIEDAIEQIEADENVSFAQPNFVYSALGDIKPLETEPDNDEAGNAEAQESGTIDPEAGDDEGLTEPETESDPEAGEAKDLAAEEAEAKDDDAPAESETEETEAADMETASSKGAEEEIEDAELNPESITNDYIYNWKRRANYLNDANVFEAWNAVKSQKRVTVAVLDSGCRLDHEDLQNNILKSYAYDSYYDRALTASSAPNGGDPTGHGTHVCGLIAAEANNGVGIAGTSYNANVLPVKIFDNYGDGATTATFLRGMEYCRQLIEDGKVNNLRVINMSVGYYSDGTKSSVDYLLENMIGIMADYYDVLCVCSGGNGDNISTPYVEPMYPSDFDNCLSVTALDGNNFNCQWSDYNQSKDISAPGDGIVSTYSGSRNSYAYMSGTSMAAPIVSGICALLWVKNPYLQVNEVIEAVEVTADENSVQWRTDATDVARKSNTGSHGAINAAKAVAYVSDRIVERGSQSIDRAEISGINTAYEYTGGKIRPVPTVSMSGVTLRKNSDYIVSYSNNVNAGTATVTIEGIGRYNGTVTKSFKIGIKNIAKCSVSLSGTSFTYTGSAINPSVTVRVSSQNTVKLRNGVDYTVTYANNIEPGKATVTIRAKGSNYTGSIVKNYTIAKANISKFSASLSTSVYTYNKKAKKPSVKVKNGGTTLVKGRDYSVSYSKNVKVGKATVKITGKGSHYTGTITKTFTIIPKGTSISKLTKKLKGFTVKWKKQTTQTTGYQIQYSTNKNFKSAKTKTIKKPKTIIASVSKLKRKKVYYVRIRTYRKVSGKNYYSKWSKIKKVKTK